MSETTSASLPSSADARSVARVRRPFRNEYTTTLFILAAILLSAFPLCSYAVFGLGADRAQTAGVLSCIYVAVMTSLFAAPWLPFPSLRGESSYRRLERMVYIWVIVYTLTVLLWQIPWILLHERIAAAGDELWAYTWWSYIDGGDMRYVEPNWLVFFIEGGADINGILSAIALLAWFRSGKKNVLSLYCLMFAAPLHIYPTLLYYTSEVVHGFPNVDTSSFINLYVKFVWSNAFWVILPFFVLVWGKQTLERTYRDRYSAAGASRSKG